MTRETLPKKYISFETPPTGDQKFAVFCKNNQMIIMESLDVWEKMKSEMVKDEDVIGWLPIEKDNNVPPFLSIPPKEISSK